MAAKISTFILTFIINLIVGIILFFALLMAMNGFKSDDAEPGLYVFIGIAAISCVATAVLSLFTCILIQKKFEKGDFISSFISILSFVTINGFVNIIGLIIGLFIAEAKRKGEL